MFSTNKGDTVLPVNSSVDFGPLYWVATKTDSQYYVKLANYGPDEKNITISIPGTKSGRLEMLTGSQFQGNTPYDVSVETVTTEIHSREGNYTVGMDPWAIAALAVS